MKRVASLDVQLRGLQREPSSGYLPRKQKILQTTIVGKLCLNNNAKHIYIYIYISHEQHSSAVLSGWPEHTSRTVRVASNGSTNAALAMECRSGKTTTASDLGSDCKAHLPPGNREGSHFHAQTRSNDFGAGSYPYGSRHRVCGRGWRTRSPRLTAPPREK